MTDAKDEQKKQYLEEEEVPPSLRQQEGQQKRQTVLVQLVPLCQKEELEKQKIPESATQKQRVQQKTLKQGKRLEVTDKQSDRQTDEMRRTSLIDTGRVKGS